MTPRTTHRGMCVPAYVRSKSSTSYILAVSSRTFYHTNSREFCSKFQDGLDENRAQPSGHIFSVLACFTSSQRNRELRNILRARARWQRQRTAEMAVPGPQQRQQRGGLGVDALTERYLRETRTLDRDSEHLDDRLRGRRQRRKQRRRGGWRDSDQNGGAAGGSTTGGGTSSSNNTTNSAWRGDDGGKSMFLASFNSGTTAPFLLLGADGGRERGSSRDPSLSTAAAAIAAAASIEAGAGGDGGSCRVQSYFTQALGDGSLCGARSK